MQLAAALGVSPALISSWENVASLAVPPVYRLEAYATFFASERSVESTPYRVLEPGELTDDERAHRDELLDDLVGLSDPRSGEPSGARSPFDGTLLHFPVGENITIVCSEMPVERLSRVPYSDPDQPDYVAAYRYADLDALLELFGHVRAANPSSSVRIRVATEMVPDEYANHLVLLGGVDWNPVTAELLDRIDVPVRQLDRADDSVSGGFEVGYAEPRTLLSPVLQNVGSRAVLREDVAHFYRSVNPFNEKRTVTVCNGMYQWGTLGVVRALTDERFRDRNERYLRTRFARMDTVSMITRVRVVNGVVITPDWSRSDDRLHEWPPPA